MLVTAVSWLQQTVLGTIATTVAIIAVASVGLMMLSGRVGIRYGVTVILGCFIIFGASAIVAGIQSFVGGGDAVAIAYPPASLPPAPPPLPPRPDRAPGASDPHAGASVPNR